MKERRGHRSSFIVGFVVLMAISLFAAAALDEMPVSAATAQIDAGSLMSDLTGPSTGSAAGDGVKEALARGVTSAVSATGKPGGFFDNPTIKIGMPPTLNRVTGLMRDAGMGAEVDALVKDMNSAAEQAAPAAKPILIDALKSMSVGDARGILTGGPTAATDYFRRSSTAQVTEAMRPIVTRQMDKIGVAQRFEALMGKAPSIPFMKTPSVDINNYVLEKSVSGLFTVIGQEEARIRKDPAAQVSPLLRSVFGGR